MPVDQDADRDPDNGRDAPAEPDATDEPAQRDARLHELEAIVYGRPTGADDAARADAESQLAALLARPRAAAGNASRPGQAHGPSGRLPGRPVVVAASVVVGLLIAGGLAVAAALPHADVAVLGPTPTPSSTPGRQGNDGLWDSIMRDFPDAVQPVVETVQPVAETALSSAVAACMNAAGYPEVTAVGDGIAVSSVPGAQLKAFDLAMYVCRVQYPIDSISVFERGQYPEETEYEAKAASIRVSGAVSGSVRLLIANPDYTVVAFQMADANRPDALVCLQLARPGEVTTRGYCTIPQIFRTVGLHTPNGVDWGPIGTPEVHPAP